MTKLLLNKKYNIYYRDNNHDFSVIKEVLEDNIYLKNGFTFKNNDVVVDIGAHIGTFSILAAKKAKLILSFEPEKDNYKMLSLNVKKNRSLNIRTFNEAVLDKNGEAELNIFEDAPGNNSIFIKSRKRQTVKTTSLKEIFDKNNITKCDFLKIDVEGSEYQILTALPKEYLSKIDKFVIEYHDFIIKKDSKKIFTLLSVAGYEVCIYGNDNFGMIYAKKPEGKPTRLNNYYNYVKFIISRYGYKMDRNLGKLGIFLNKRYPKLYRILKQFH